MSEMDYFDGFDWDDYFERERERTKARTIEDKIEISMHGYNISIEDGDYENLIPNLGVMIRLIGEKLKKDYC